MLLFVYGTLKRGGANHARLEGQQFKGRATTQPLYRMHLIADYPGLVAAPGGGSNVKGELWEVDPEKLRELDAFEGSHEGLFRRGPVRLLPPHDGTPAEAYFYGRPIGAAVDLGTDFCV